MAHQLINQGLADILSAQSNSFDSFIQNPSSTDSEIRRCDNNLKELERIFYLAYENDQVSDDDLEKIQAHLRIVLSSFKELIISKEKRSFKSKIIPKYEKKVFGRFEGFLEDVSDIYDTRQVLKDEKEEEFVSWQDAKEKLNL